MVDTIVMRIHDLRKHEALSKYINTNFKGTSKNTAYLTEEETEQISKSPVVTAKDYIDYFWNSKTGTHLVRYKSQERLNNSGHYYFHIYEDIDRDFLEFNFSIPKYKYGTNVLMFCEHHWNKNYTFYNNSSLDFNLKRIYDLLTNFILNFFNNEFVYNDIVDLSDVEINRIDFCFNQVFEDKRFALEYLEYQKKLRKKNLRIDSNNFREYETSLMYTTKRYSLKIYHKGTEYNKHDKKEHSRINKEKGSSYFDIDGIQQFSDRMLRYEVTFRDSMLSYLYNHKVFRKNCPIHKKRYEIYKNVESIKAKNDVIAQKTSTYTSGYLKSRYIDNHPYLPIEKEDLVVHKKMSKLLNRKRCFLLKTSQSTDDFNAQTINTLFEQRARFSKTLIRECSIFFKTFIQDFQIKEKPSEAVVNERIDKYNFEHLKKIPKNEMLKFYAILQYLSFEDIMKKGIYSRATFYRYKNRFEKIGVTQNNIMLSDFIHTKVDLSQYHTHLTYNKLIKF